MIEFLNESFLWWHWIAFGMILLIVEMSTGTFLMLGLGVSAMIVGVFDVLFVTSFTIEIFLWILLSSLSIWAWFKWFKTPVLTQSGQSNYKLDTLGIVMEEIHPHARGKVTFDRPVLGNTSWHSTATIHIPQNTRVQIVQVNGQLIEVEPLK